MKKIIFLLDNFDNPQIPEEGMEFSKRNHAYYAPMFINKPLKLQETQTIQKVLRLDITSNFYLAETDEAYFIYPVKRFSRSSFEKKIYFAIIDKIPSSYSFKKLKIYYVNDSNMDSVIDHRTVPKIDFPTGIGLLYKDIYIAESLNSTFYFFVNNA